MAETAIKVLEILELTQSTTERIAAILERMSERSETNTLALARMIDENHRALATLIADNNRYLAQILERVVNATDRTERMTAEILTRLAAQQGSGH